MKVACQHCGASYSVADEKVTGRKVKLRCKKCGESIVVDGTLEFATTPVGSTAPGSQPDAVWHVAVGDETRGPYTLEELASYCAEGSVASDALVFRDGWSDWRALQDVGELQAKVSERARPRVSRPPAPPARKRTASVMPEAPRLMGRDPFGDDGLSPRVSSEEMLSGLPREGTVQFSIDQIRALSAVSAPSVVPTISHATSPGYATGEASGLIDVSSLVASEAPAAFKPIAGAELSPLDTMAPATLPIVAQPAGGIDFRTKIIAGVLSFGFVLAAAVAVLALVMRQPAPVAAVAAAAPVAVAQPVAAPVAPAAPPAAPAPAAEPQKLAAAEPEKTDDAEPVAREERAANKSSRSGSSSSHGSASSRHGSKASSSKSEDDPLAMTKTSAPKASATKSATKTSSADDIDDLITKGPEKSAPKKGGSSSIDDLMDVAVTNAKKPPPKSEEPKPSASDLPMTPSRDDMLGALKKAKANVASCKGSGVATAAITISGKGRATSVDVSGVDGAAKSCVEKAVRATPFPKFQKESFDVKFPFKLTS